jgi:hypothetical protein
MLAYYTEGWTEGWRRRLLSARAAAPRAVRPRPGPVAPLARATASPPTPSTVGKTQVGPEAGPTAAFSSCIPTGMHGPTRIFWADLTLCSLQEPRRGDAQARGEGHGCRPRAAAASLPLDFAPWTSLRGRGAGPAGARRPEAAVAAAAARGGGLTSEKYAKLAQKLGKLQSFIAVFPQKCMANLYILGQPNTFLAADCLTDCPRPRAHISVARVGAHCTRACESAADRIIIVCKFNEGFFRMTCASIPRLCCTKGSTNSKILSIVHPPWCHAAIIISPVIYIFTPLW